MKVVLLSDTHGHLDESMLKYCREADEIWHAGDIGTVQVSDELASITRLRAVYGNIDGHELRMVHPEINSFEIEGLKVMMIHIGGYPGRYAPGVLQKLKLIRPGLFICGHSHILKVSRDPALNNMLCINPGAAGKNGFHQVRTMVRMEIGGGKVTNLDVIELGKK